MSSRWYALLFVVIFAVTAPVPLWPGSDAIGTVIGSLNARIGQQTLRPNTAIFSGDILNVGNGTAVVVLEHGGRMTLGRDTDASFRIESQAVTLVLGRGIVSLFQEGQGAALRVRAASATIQTGEANTAGSVTRLGNALVVTVKRGVFLVKRAGKVVRIVHGQTMVVNAQGMRGGAKYSLVGSGNSKLGVGALALDGAAVIMGSIAVSRATDAHNASVAASLGFNSATTAAGLANAVAVSAGCAINATQAPNVPSPFIPPPNDSCP